MFFPRAVGASLVAMSVATFVSAACSAKRDVAQDTVVGGKPDSTTLAAATSRASSVAMPSPESIAQARASKAGALTPPASTGAAAARCGRGLLNVMVKRGESGGAMPDSVLRAQAARILEPVRGLVQSVDYSAVIRTFRVHLADSATSPTVDRVVQQLRGSRDVDDVSRDECNMHIDRPSTSVPATSSRPPASPGADADTLPDR